MTNTTMTPFNHPEFGTVRTVVGSDGEPWFVAKDVAGVLGYTDADQAVRKHCKATNTYPVVSTGQVRHVKITPLVTGKGIHLIRNRLVKGL